jgi:Rad3-related DNA helicase
MVLLAPSLERGVDLPKDQCGVIIIAKVPYPSIGDKQVNTRLYSTPNGQLWFQVQTVRAIVQSTGRGMRSADDFCISYILDKQFAKIPKELLPGYWKEAIR